MARLKAMTSPISVLFPAPLEPTSAVVEPAGATNEMSRSTGTPSTYSKSTWRNSIAPSSSGTRAFEASSASSVAMSRISRMRSSPANASEICVPMEAIETSGAATSPMKKM